MNRLPNDVARCPGGDCPDKRECERYIQTGRVMAEHPGIRGEKCNGFIGRKHD